MDGKRIRCGDRMEMPPGIPVARGLAPTPDT
jgi:hypothetical protein